MCNSDTHISSKTHRGYNIHHHGPCVSSTPSILARVSALTPGIFFQLKQDCNLPALLKYCEEIVQFLKKWKTKKPLHITVVPSYELFQVTRANKLLKRKNILKGQSKNCYRITSCIKTLRGKYFGSLGMPKIKTVNNRTSNTYKLTLIFWWHSLQSHLLIQYTIFH
jgi:hypothetical protein